jgi:hypothetical protein
MLYILLLLGVINLGLVFVIFSRKANESDPRLEVVLSNQSRIEGGIKQDFQTNGVLITNIEKEIRNQVEQKFTQQSQSIKEEFRGFNNFLNTKFTDINLVGAGFTQSKSVAGVRECSFSMSIPIWTSIHHSKPILHADWIFF